jgi:hypothetical protein
VSYPVEDLKFGEKLSFHDLLQIELKIGGPAQPLGIAEYP